MVDFDYIRLSIRGTIAGGEAWSVNPTFDAFNSYTGISPADMNSLALAIRGVTVPTVLRGLLSSSADITSFRVEGRNSATDLVIAAEAAPSGGAISGTGVPSKTYQTSIVTSLLTGLAGASARGRLYWPALGATIGTNLRLSSPTAAAVAQSMSEYLTSVQAAINGVTAFSGSSLIVYSPTTGTKRTVTEISVGDVLDVQRRRRDKAVESRSPSAFPYTP